MSSNLVMSLCLYYDFFCILLLFHITNSSYQNLLKSQKNYEKRAILKIWELVFFCGVKIQNGKLALNWCILRNKTKTPIIDHSFWLRFRHTKPLWLWAINEYPAIFLTLKFKVWSAAVVRTTVVSLLWKKADQWDIVWLMFWNLPMILR